MSNFDPPKKNIIEKWLIGFAVFFALSGFLVFIGVTVSLILNLYNKPGSSGSDYLGNIGSFTGGVVGALWSLVSVLLFYVTLRLQQKEITLQRHELEMTREEIKGQKEQMVLQNQTLRQQNFENTFFHLLKLHNNLVNELDLREATGTRNVLANGRECFLIYYKRLESYIIMANRENGTSVNKASLDATVKGYVTFFDANQNNLDNYFRSLCQLLHFIDTSSIDISDSYAQFIIAQLSSHELSILFYSGLNMTDGIKLKNYIEKFGLLQNLDESLVFNKEHISAYQFQTQTI